MHNRRRVDDSQRKSAGYLAVQGLGLAVMKVLTTPTWEGQENIPSGAALIVSNHISHADPVTLGHALVRAGHVPRYMGKSELFDVPVLGRVLRHAGQIPVTRAPGKADAAYREALNALHTGNQVVLYPEGTVTRDPHHWPMRAKTGAARLALETSVPVVPVGQWGPQELWRPGARLPVMSRRIPVTVRFGQPVQLDDLRESALSSQTLRRATDRIMDAITVLVSEIRGEPPPPQRWDSRSHNQSEEGRF